MSCKNKIGLYDCCSLIQGNCLEVLADLPSDSIQCVVTSPPYWGLRKYSGDQELEWKSSKTREFWRCRYGYHDWVESNVKFHKGQVPDRKWKNQTAVSEAGNAASNYCFRCGAWRGAFGLEPTIEMYIEHSVQILREIRRVLRSDGVCFYNLGDSYSAQPGQRKDTDKAGAKQQTVRASTGCPSRAANGLKPKDLCLIPARVAIAAQADGWWVRSDIIWNKPNPMPESVQDRPTDAYEHILMFTKSQKYFWDAEAVKEPAAWERWGKQTTLSHDENQRVMPDKSKEELQENTTRNLRNVWTFPTQPYKGAHFATFPEELARRCIKAASSEKGCCPKCGVPQRRIIKRSRSLEAGRKEWGCGDKTTAIGPVNGVSFLHHKIDTATIYWGPDCDCEVGKTRPCIVLDPFAGSGTVATVARSLGRCFLNIDLAYQDLQKARIEKGVRPTKK